MSQGAAPELPLRDIVLPVEPSWWPPAPGWWLLMLLLLAALWVGGWQLHRVWSAHRRRQAILRQLEGELAEADSAEQALQRAAGFLRRWTLAQQANAATQRGEAWLEFLDAADPVRPFSRGPGRLLLDGPYRRQVDPAEVQALLGLIRQRLRGRVR